MIKKILILAFCVLTLAACAPTMFGVPQDQWNTLSPTEKKSVIKAYNQRQAANDEAEAERQQIEAQNAPLNNAISLISGAISKKSKHKTTKRYCNYSGTECHESSRSSSIGFGVG